VKPPSAGRGVGVWGLGFGVWGVEIEDVEIKINTTTTTAITTPFVKLLCWSSSSFSLRIVSCIYCIVLSTSFSESALFLPAQHHRAYLIPLQLSQHQQRLHISHIIMLAISLRAAFKPTRYLQRQQRDSRRAQAALRPSHFSTAAMRSRTELMGHAPIPRPYAAWAAATADRAVASSSMG
jgi:hypothetical protein